MQARRALLRATNPSPARQFVVEMRQQALPMCSLRALSGLATLQLVSACGQSGASSSNEQTVIAAESAERSSAGPPASTAPGSRTRFEPRGVWVLSSVVNGGAAELDLERAAKMFITSGDSPDQVSVTMSEHGTVATAGREGPEPFALSFVSPDAVRFGCRGETNTLYCDNGEPQGVGTDINPKWRGFGAARLCGAPGQLRTCAPADRDYLRTLPSGVR